MRGKTKPNAHKKGSFHIYEGKQWAQQIWLARAQPVHTAEREKKKRNGFLKKKLRVEKSNITKKIKLSEFQAQKK